jgi:hypothetical protein
MLLARNHLKTGSTKKYYPPGIACLIGMVFL